MKIKGKRGLFNLVGIVIVTLWLGMLGHLVARERFAGGAWTETNAEKGLGRSIPAEREWMAIYLGNRKVGYSTSRIQPVGAGYMIREEIFVRLNLMGFPSDIHALTSAIVDEHFLLKTFRFQTRSGVVSFEVHGKVEGNWIFLQRGTKGFHKPMKIQCPKPPVLSAGFPYFLKKGKIEVGTTYRLPLFDPSTLSQQEGLIRVAERTSVTIGKVRYPAYRLDGRVLGQHLTFWVDDRGSILKEEGFMGLSLVRSSALEAPRGIAPGGGEDFYGEAAVPVDKKLRDPERLTYLRLRVTGLDGSGFGLNAVKTGRQRYENGILEVSSESLPRSGPHGNSPTAFPPETKTYLKAGLSIESDEEPIMSAARRLVGKVGDPIEKAKLLMSWVYRSVEKRPVPGIPSALEVLRTKQGDCNEHTVLLTALLRASGVPARQCAGLVYARGKFFYHAWTEAYLGKWISIDATLNQMPVDATHVKLVEGGLEKQVELVRLMGRLRFQVLDYRYDPTD